QWDSRFLTCTATVVPPIDPATGLPNPNAGQPNLPTGYVIITAYNANRNVKGTTQLSVHVRAARITLSSPVYNGPVSVTGGVSSIPTGQYPSATQCVSQ